jgi:hypothetical protein
MYVIYLFYECFVKVILLIICMICQPTYVCTYPINLVYALFPFQIQGLVYMNLNP